MKLRFIFVPPIALLLVACEGVGVPTDAMDAEKCEIVEAPVVIDDLPEEEPKDCGKHGGDEHIKAPPGQDKK